MAFRIKLMNSKGGIFTLTVTAGCEQSARMEAESFYPNCEIVAVDRGRAHKFLRAY